MSILSNISVDRLVVSNIGHPRWARQYVCNDTYVERLSETRAWSTFGRSTGAAGPEMEGNLDRSKIVM
jgi:hypothetical protein